MRLEVLKRDGSQCQIVGPGCEGRATHVDHIVPLFEGGRRLDPDNLRAACETCNLKRARVRQSELARFALRSTAPPESSPSRKW